jgi:hypothetical protein
MTDKKVLNPGDVIYGETYGKITKHIIDRVTATQAITKEGERFKREYSWSVSAIGASTWSSTSYRVETAENKEKYLRQHAIGKLRAMDYTNVTTDTLIKILSLLNSDQEDNRSVATTDHSSNGDDKQKKITPRG